MRCSAHLPTCPIQRPFWGRSWRPWFAALIACLTLRVTSGEPKASKSTIAAPGFHSVPLQFKDYRLVLDTRLNGSKCSTAIDTGMPLTSIDASRAKKLRGYDPSRDKFTDPLFAEIIPKSPSLHTNFRILETLDFQGIQILGTPAKVSRNEIQKQGELISLQRMNETVAYTSLFLGSDFLTRHHAIIACLNPPTLLLQFSTAATNTTELHRQLIASGYRSIPMHFNLEGWEVPVEVNGVTIHLGLASCANVTVVDPSLATGLNLEGGKTMVEVYGLGRRKTEIGHHVAQSVRFGDATYSKLSIYSGDLSRWGFGEGLQGKCSGVLGIDLLSQGRAIIDCGNHRLYMLPPSSK